MSTHNNRTRLWTWISLIGLTVFFGIGFPQIGFFFKPVQTYAMTVTALFVLLVTIVLDAWRTRMPIWLTLAFGYAVYTWLTTLWAANAASAVAGAVVITGAVLLGLLGTVLSAGAKRYVLTLLAIAGPIVYLYGEGTVFSWWKFNSAFLGGQMNSIFQYHNTFGAFELLSFTITLGLFAVAKRWWDRALYIMFGAWSVLGVVASYSREVWLLLPVAMILTLLVQWRKKRLGRAVGDIVYVLITAIGAAPFAVSALSKTSVHMGELSSLTVVVAAILLSFVDVGVSQGLKTTKMRSFVLGIVGLVVVVVAAFLVHHEAGKLGSITQRVSSIQLKDFSVQQRLLFYVAAIHMWAANWHSTIFGAGWGAWTSKFLAYQQYPYQSTKTHSIVMNNLVNGGVIGFLLWISTIITGATSGFRAIGRADKPGTISAVAVIGAIMMFLHGAFDFDFSYALITATFFLLLGIGAVPQEPVHVELRNEHPVAPSGPIPPRVVVSTTANLLMGASALATVILGGMLSVAEHMYWKATNTDMNTGTAAQSDLQTAIKWAPYYAEPYADLAQLEYTQYQQAVAQKSQTQQQSTQLWQTAQTAAAKDPWNPQTQYTAASIAYNMGQLNQAYQWSERAALDSPFHAQYPATFMGMGLWATVVQYKQNPEVAQQHLTDIVAQLAFAKQSVAKQQHMTFGYKPDWTYQIDAPMDAYAAAADYLLGQYQASLADLQSLPSTDNDPNTTGLVDIVTLLDNQHLHKGYEDAKVTKEIDANTTLTQEYQDLLALRPIS